MTDAQGFETPQRQQRRNRAFETWLDQPLTKVVLSMIPKTDPPEAVVSILKAAFEAGYTMGSGEVVTDLTLSVLNSATKKGP